MKNYNYVKDSEIIDELAKRLPHINKSKIRLVFHLLQREIKISLVQGKEIKIPGFFNFRIITGYVKKFWCVFHKQIRKTIINSKFSTTIKIKK